MAGIPEDVIVHMMSGAYGSDEAIDELDSSKVPVNPVTEGMRAETKASVAGIFQILDLMCRVKKRIFVHARGAFQLQASWARFV